MHEHHDIPQQVGLFAASALGAVSWTIGEIARHGPSWNLVPPILIGVASVLGAVRGLLNDAQARRHKDERHRAEMAALHARTAQ
jgi:hypothetical protein